MTKKTRVSSLFLAAILAIYFAARAGNLEPEFPPAPTMKTLDQCCAGTVLNASLDPLTISSAGYYFLTENRDTAGPLTIQTGVDDFVELDLRGFRMRGLTISGAANVTIRNGVITGPGISINNSTSFLVTDINVDGCPSIQIVNSDGVIRDSRVHGFCGGIEVTNAATQRVRIFDSTVGPLTGWAVRGNNLDIHNLQVQDILPAGGGGVWLEGRSIITDSTIAADRFLGPEGIGIRTDGGDVVDGNRVTQFEWGIQVRGDSVVVRNVSFDNGIIDIGGNYDIQLVGSGIAPVATAITATSPLANLTFTSPTP